MIAHSFGRAALAEIEATTARYRAEAGERVATAFVLEIDRAVAMACRFPVMGSQAGSQNRRLLLIGFPHALVYRIQNDHLRIIAIAHERKRARYWRWRI